MLKQQARLFNILAIVIDLMVAVVAFILAYHLRRLSGQLGDLKSHLWILLAVLPVWYFLLDRFHLYASLRTRPPGQIFANLLKVHAIGGVVASSVIYLVSGHGYSRGLFGTFIVL